MKSPQAPVLELRVAEHYPTFLHLKNGTPLVQPPAIEGFVERIRPNSQAKQPLYLVSHNGNLFTLSSHNAEPPSPPGSALMSGDIEEYKQNTMEVEIKRGIYQLMHAHGVCELRNVVAVRRAFQTVPQHHHDQKDDRLTEESSWFNVWSQVDERTNSDNEDGGGEAGLSKLNDKPYLRMKRSFELLLNTGRVVRFEVCGYFRGFILSERADFGLLVDLLRSTHAAWQMNGWNVCGHLLYIGNSGTERMRKMKSTLHKLSTLALRHRSEWMSTKSPQKNRICQHRIRLWILCLIGVLSMDAGRSSKKGNCTCGRVSADSTSMYFCH
jgi:hypothetical protein